MSDQLLGTIITGVCLLLATLIANRNTAGKVKRIEHKVNSIDDQVSNNHIDPQGKPINLREEADARHRENSDKIDHLANLMGEVVETLDTVKRSVARLWRVSDATVEQIEEMTQPRSAYAPPVKHRRTE